MPARLGEGARAGPAPPRGVNPSWPEEEAPVLLMGDGGGGIPWGSGISRGPGLQPRLLLHGEPLPDRGVQLGVRGGGTASGILKGARSPGLARKLQGRRGCFGPRG